MTEYLPYQITFIILSVIYIKYGEILKKVFIHIFMNIKNKKHGISKDQFSSFSKNCVVIEGVKSKGNSFEKDIENVVSELSSDYEKQIYENKIMEIANKMKKSNGGTVKVPFAEAIYILRHYRKKAVVSEDGKVVLSGDSKFYTTFDEIKSLFNNFLCSKKHFKVSYT